MENGNSLFREEQRFRQKWLWAILIISSAFLTEKVYATGNLEYIIALVVFMSVIILVIIVRLETAIEKDGIYFRFYPFHQSFRKVEWSELSYIYVRQYNSLLEYGGWGIRWSLWGNGKALSVSGNWGLQLLFKSGMKLLIGTQNPYIIKDILSDMHLHCYKLPKNDSA